MTDRNKTLIRKAIQMATESIQNGGGPFGAIITKKGQIIASASNSVTKDNDPTAHAEVNAIRQASRTLETFDLSGCEIYTSCEPCPMCLGAIYWARLDAVYYACSREDANDAGFDDSFIYNEIAKQPNERKILFTKLLRDEAQQSFKIWKTSEAKTEY